MTTFMTTLRPFRTDNFANDTTSFYSQTKLSIKPKVNRRIRPESQGRKLRLKNKITRRYLQSCPSKYALAKRKMFSNAKINNKTDDINMNVRLTK